MHVPGSIEQKKTSAWPYLRAEVARAEDVVNLPRHKQGLELLVQVWHTVWDVQIADHQHQHDAE